MSNKTLIDRRDEHQIKALLFFQKISVKNYLKSYPEKVLVSIIVMQLKKLQGVNKMGIWAGGSGVLLREGILRFKDFGFLKGCLKKFFRHGIISDEMATTIDAIPDNAQKAYERAEHRKDDIIAWLYHQKDPRDRIFRRAS